MIARIGSTVAGQSNPVCDANTGHPFHDASVAGVTGQSRHAAYAATKGGINALTQCAAVDWGPVQIRVNALCPAGVWTDALRTWCHEQPDKAQIEQYLDRIHALGLLSRSRTNRHRRRIPL